MCIYMCTICILIMCTIKTHVKPFDKYNKMRIFIVSKSLSQCNRILPLTRVAISYWIDKGEKSIEQ